MRAWLGVSAAFALLVACSSGDGDGLATDASFLTPDSGAGGSSGTGAAGFGGASGASGNGGTSGASGASGTGGAAGSGGTSGASGAPGSGGVSGASGSDAGDAGPGEGGPFDGTAGGAGATGGDASFDAGPDAAGDAAADAKFDASDGASADASADGASDASVDAVVCVANSYHCAADTLQRCAADGSGYTFVAQCNAGSCSASTGVCLACVVGARDCSGNQARLCDSAGQWQVSETCGGTKPICAEGLCQPNPPSCTGLAANCGASSASSCCGTREVEAQSFLRSYDGVLYPDSSYAAQISSVWLDRYEVTVGRFRKFVDAGGGLKSTAPAAGAGAHPKIAGSGWMGSFNGELSSNTSALKAALACNALATWSDAAAGNETRPINCVTWFEAFAFCAWDGGRLPTEAEWNAMASGGSEQRVYPWSTPPSSTTLSASHASYWLNAGSTCMGDGVPGCTLADLIFVGSKPLGNGRWGHADAAGNVAEWTRDSFKNPYSSTSCVDCAELSGATRTIRGGSFFGQQAQLPAAARGFAAGDQRFFSVGFRCARDL